MFWIWNWFNWHLFSHKIFSTLQIEPSICNVLFSNIVSGNYDLYASMSKICKCRILDGSCFEFNLWLLKWNILLLFYFKKFCARIFVRTYVRISLIQSDSHDQFNQSLILVYFIFLLLMYKTELEIIFNNSNKCKSKNWV